VSTTPSTGRHSLTRPATPIADDIDDIDDIDDCSPAKRPRSTFTSAINADMTLVVDSGNRPLLAANAPISALAALLLRRQQASDDVGALDLTGHGVGTMRSPFESAQLAQLFRHQQAQQMFARRLQQQQWLMAAATDGGGGSDDDWESMMEVNETDEMAKIREMVGDKPMPPLTDPNQCLICRRVLSCKSALQMHYR
jgi:hypothetical protein